MSRRNVFTIAVVACILALVPTISSASSSSAPTFTLVSAKSTHKITINVTQDHTLAGKMVKGGSYQLKMDDSKVAFVADGKVVAEASGEWKDSPAKASYDFLKVEGDAITEIHIGGQSRYFSVQG